MSQKSEPRRTRGEKESSGAAGLVGRALVDVVVEQLLDQVDVGHHHAAAAVAGEAQSVHGISVVEVEAGAEQ